MAFIRAAGVQKIESLLGSDRFQVVVQMCRELLSTDMTLAENFSACFLPDLQSKGIAEVQENLSTASAAITFFSLVSCSRREGIKLQ